MTASKSKKDRCREDNDSILEKIKQDNIEAARKQQSKIYITSYPVRRNFSNSKKQFPISAPKDL